MTSPTNSQLRCLLRPDQTGNGAEVRAVTEFMLSQTNGARKCLSNVAPDSDGHLVGRNSVEPEATLCLPPRLFGLDGISPAREAHSLTSRAACPVDENARSAPDFFGHVHFRRDELGREPGGQTNRSE